MARRHVCRLGMILMLLTCMCAQGWSQRSATAELQQARKEDRIIRDLESKIPTTQRTLFDFGGWYLFDYINWDDVDRKVDFTEHDLRLWFNLSIDDIHQVYARVRTHILRFHGDDAYDGNNWDLEGPNLDMGWYRLHISNLYRRYLGKDPCLEAELKVGRQYMDVGTGMVLSQILDAVRVDLAKGSTSLTLFGAKSVRSQDSLDLSLPGGHRSKRNYFGVQLNKRVLARHEVFAYALLTRDHSREKPPDATQEYDYDADYYGVGSTGALISDLRYWCEFVWQRGKSFASGTTTVDEKIRAFGGDVGLEFFLKGLPLRPAIEAEYAFGQGDPDRTSPTNTIGGNLIGTTDRGFLPFGYMDTGASFAGRLANLQVIRVGASFHPFDYCEKLKNIEVGMSYYWLRKDEAAGGITDPSADLPSSDVGREIDVYANWRILSDVLWTARWGHFMPGDAYSNQSSRNYFITGIIYTF